MRTPRSRPVLKHLEYTPLPCTRVGSLRADDIPSGSIANFVYTSSLGRKENSECEHRCFERCLSWWWPGRAPPADHRILMRLEQVGRALPEATPAQVAPQPAEQRVRPTVGRPEVGLRAQAERRAAEQVELQAGGPVAHLPYRR
jgi:hypothetical protein